MTEQGRWTKEPAGRGEDPRRTEADQHDAERAEHVEENRPVTNDQPRVGQRAISSDQPGVDAGGYPEEPPD
jgi:hypothetical protein